MIALLRGINVGGHNKIPMADLRGLCEKLGWAGVQSYIQSGNLVFDTGASTVDVESQLENAIQRHFGLSIPIIVRTNDAWQDLLDSNPFPGASNDAPNLVMLGLSKKYLLPGTVRPLQGYAGKGERIVQTDTALWIHFPERIGRSKLTPAVLDRAAGSAVTMRNWRTVLKLGEMSDLR